MNLILGAGLLGRYLYRLCRENNKMPIKVIGYPYNSTPNPFLLGANKATEKIVDKAEVVRPASVCFTLWPHGKMTNGGKPKYKRPKVFQRDIDTDYAYRILVSRIPFMDDSAITKAKAMYMRLKMDEKFNVTVTCSMIKSDGSFDMLSFECPAKELNIFITIPIVNFVQVANEAMLTFGLDSFNHDSSRFYHVYSMKVETNYFDYIFPDTVQYMYIEDHLFKNPYLKRIVPLTNGLYEFQFLARKRLCSKEIMALVNRFTRLVPKGQKYKVAGIKRTAVEIRKRNNKLDKIMTTLLPFSALVLGRFAMQDHSRLHHNLAVADKFIKRNLLSE